MVATKLISTIDANPIYLRPRIKIREHLRVANLIDDKIIFDTLVDCAHYFQ